MLKTVEKIGPILQLFTPEQPEWRTSDIARALNMPKSSAHSLVCTLADIGLLSITAQRRVRLGWALITLGERMRPSAVIAADALPAMLELAGALRETVLLAVLDRDEVHYVERVQGLHPSVRVTGLRVGARAPAHCTAAGKVLLADRGPSEVDALVARTGLRRMTARTLDTPEALEAELEQVRARGYALERRELVPDLSSIAVPVHARDGSVVAALAVAVPHDRFEAVRHDALARLVVAEEAIARGPSAAPVTHRRPAASPGRRRPARRRAQRPGGEARRSRPVVH